MAPRRPTTITPPIHEVPSVAEPGDEPHRQSPLQISAEGMALLRERLRAANECNPESEAQFRRLEAVLRTLLERLRERFGDEIERVLATGNWAQRGIDLRTIPDADIIVRIVTLSSERRLDFYLRVSEGAFADLGDRDILVQFGVLTLPQWTRGLALARAEGREDELGIPLLLRA